MAWLVVALLRNKTGSELVVSVSMFSEIQPRAVLFIKLVAIDHHLHPHGCLVSNNHKAVLDCTLHEDGDPQEEHGQSTADVCDVGQRRQI